MRRGIWVLLCVALGLPVLLVVLHTIVRMIRHVHKSPIPQWAAGLIDHPLRRRIQPPFETAIRHGIEPGMKVLEVGPGNGTYTLGAARRVGMHGRVVAVDSEPKMIARVQNRAKAEGVENIEARVADVYALPYEDGTFDAAFVIAVIGEIPDADRAMREFYRVLSPTGTLAFSELLADPDYPLAKTLVAKAARAGFGLAKKAGNVFYYTLIFEKDGSGSEGEGTGEENGR